MSKSMFGFVGALVGTAVAYTAWPEYNKRFPETFLHETRLQFELVVYAMIGVIVGVVIGIAVNKMASNKDPND